MAYSGKLRTDKAIAAKNTNDEDYQWVQRDKDMTYGAVQTPKFKNDVVGKYHQRKALANIKRKADDKYNRVQKNLKDNK